MKFNILLASIISSVISADSQSPKKSLVGEPDYYKLPICSQTCLRDARSKFDKMKSNNQTPNPDRVTSTVNDCNKQCTFGTISKGGNNYTEDPDFSKLPKCKRDCVDDARDKYDEMESNGETPNPDHVAIFINHCVAKCDFPDIVFMEDNPTAEQDFFKLSKCKKDCVRRTRKEIDAMKSKGESPKPNNIVKSVNDCVTKCD